MTTSRGRIGWGALKGNAASFAALESLVASGRSGGSLLFDGPEGVGKRAAAGRFAAAVVCSSSAGRQPCDKCVSCRQFASGVHPDAGFWEPVAARATARPAIGTDAIREVSKWLGYKPMISKCRIVVINDAHRMTVQAQQAFLKTLEEPPAYAWVVLVTANPSGLLPTVRSRCMRIRWTVLSSGEMDEFVGGRYGASGDAGVLALSEGRPGRYVYLKEEAATARLAADAIARGSRCATVPGLSRPDRVVISDAISLLSLQVLPEREMSASRRWLLDADKLLKANVPPSRVWDWLARRYEGSGRASGATPPPKLCEGGIVGGKVAACGRG